MCVKKDLSFNSVLRDRGPIPAGDGAKVTGVEEIWTEVGGYLHVRLAMSRMMYFSYPNMYPEQTNHTHARLRSNRRPPPS